jgi:hypothetical protein
MAVTAHSGALQAQQHGQECNEVFGSQGGARRIGKHAPRHSTGLYNSTALDRIATRPDLRRPTWTVASRRRAMVCSGGQTFQKRRWSQGVVTWQAFGSLLSRRGR